MTRKRSSYRPRAVMSNPLSLMRPASPAARQRVMARFLTALEALTRGEHPGEAEWRDLSDAINTVETLVLHQHKLVAAEVMPTLNVATEALVAAASRFKAGQRLGVDAAGLQALRGVLDVYEQCLEGLTEREMAMAQAETQRRVNLILRSTRPNAKVIAL